MANSYLFTSESVSEGHPDKVADQISDAILDAILKEDKRCRVAVETLVKTGVAIVAGEVTTNAWVDIEGIVRETVLGIGYNSSEMGFDGASCGVLNVIGKQSADIAQGVDRGDPRKQGAGDQGLMFGFATNETDVLMPAAITLSHRLVERQAKVRKQGKLPWLRPDAKSQVTLRYENDRPVAIEAVVLSTQHSDDISTKKLREAVTEEILLPYDQGGITLSPQTQEEHRTYLEAVFWEAVRGESMPISTLRGKIEEFFRSLAQARPASTLARSRRLVRKMKYVNSVAPWQ